MRIDQGFRPMSRKSFETGLRYKASNQSTFSRPVSDLRQLTNHKLGFPKPVSDLEQLTNYKLAFRDWFSIWKN
jgi:hypothetical protein